MRDMVRPLMYGFGLTVMLLALSGCAGSFARSARSLANAEGLVDVARPSSSPAGKAQANSPVKLGVPASRLQTPPVPKGVVSDATSSSLKATTVAKERVPSRDAVDPPALTASKAVATNNTTDGGFLLPAKIKTSRSSVPREPGSAVARQSSSLPADMQSLLSPDVIDRGPSAKKVSSSELASVESPPGLIPTTPAPAARTPARTPGDIAPAEGVAEHLANKIPRAIPTGEARPASVAEGVALTEPSPLDSVEGMKMLASGQEPVRDIRQVSHVAGPTEPASPPQADADDSKPRTVAIREVPSLLKDKSEGGVNQSIPTPPPIGLATPPVADVSVPPVAPTPTSVDANVVRALADAALMEKSKVTLASATTERSEATSVGSPTIGEAKSELTLDRFQFCTEVNGFASVVARTPGPMYPSERLLAYVEIKNFDSIEREGLFETKLSCQMKLEDASGKVFFSQDFGDIVDRCVDRRQDFFCHFLLTVPDTLVPGKYRWRLTITDQSSKQTKEQVSEVEIGSGEPGERNVSS
jgi:hypothetical protein